MSDPQDQGVKLEYLKMLVTRLDACTSSFNTTLRQFYTFALIFFLVSRFYSSELDLLGLKIQIPQSWILAIAPLILSFYYLRLVSLYDTGTDYAYEIERIAPDALSGKEWKIQNWQIAAIEVSSFWFKDLSLIDQNREAIIYRFLHASIWIVIAISVFVVPLPIITYFIWILWKSQGLLLPSVISCISACILIPSLILLVYQIREEL